MQNFSAIRLAVRWPFQKNSWGCFPPPPMRARVNGSYSPAFGSPPSTCCLFPSLGSLLVLPALGARTTAPPQRYSAATPAPAPAPCSVLRAPCSLPDGADSKGWSVITESAQPPAGSAVFCHATRSLRVVVQTTANQPPTGQQHPSAAVTNLTPSPTPAPIPPALP